MRVPDSYAVLLVFALVLSPAAALAIYGFRRGRRAFHDQLQVVGSPFQARWKSLSTSLKVAIIPAFLALFGRIRINTMHSTEADDDLVWQCLIAVALIAVVFVIIPFMLGIQRGYRLVAAETSR